MAPTRLLHLLLAFGFASILSASQTSSLRLRSSPGSLMDAIPWRHRPGPDTISTDPHGVLGRELARAADSVSMSAQEPRARGRTPKDSEDKTSAPFFDKFWFGYWGTVIVTTAGLFLFKLHTRVEVPEEPQSEAVHSEVLPSDNVDSSSATSSARLHRSTSVLRESFGPVRKGSMMDDDDNLFLPQNMWALVCVAALDKAKLKSGRTFAVWPVALTAGTMGCLQLVGLFLMIHDLDPKADPITVNPSMPHGSCGTVNAMKCVMAVIMVVALISEAEQCMSILHVTLCIKQEDVKVGKWVPILFAAFQYLIACLVVWTGIAVILSFQSVPDIVYSSMAIMCISNVDEMFFDGFKAVFGVDAQFDNIERELDDHKFPLWYFFLGKFLLIFPVLLGMQLFFRAWYTGIMPTARIVGVFADVYGFWS